jgi:hypothetical protein
MRFSAVPLSLVLVEVCARENLSSTRTEYVTHVEHGPHVRFVLLVPKRGELRKVTWPWHTSAGSIFPSNNTMGFTMVGWMLPREMVRARSQCT